MDSLLIASLVAAMSGCGRAPAESHRGLFPEHAAAYGENVRAKLERAGR